MKVERMIERGRRETRVGVRRGSIESILSEDDMRSLLRRSGGSGDTATDTATETDGEGEVTNDEFEDVLEKEKEEGEDGIMLK